MIPIAAKMGFNCVVEWPFPSAFQDDDWPTRELLDAAANHNLLVVVHGPFERHGHKMDYARSVTQRLERAVAGVLAYRTHPALLSYKSADEPHYSEDKHHELSAVYRQIKRRDPHHPVFVNHWWTGPDPRFTGVSDWVGKDIYPVANGCFTQLERYWMRVRDLTANRRPFIWLTQAYASWPSRLPSQLELRHMTYLMILRGAKGCCSSPIRPGLCIRATPAIWWASFGG
jgi:hypothetical protein